VTTIRAHVRGTSMLCKAGILTITGVNVRSVSVLRGGGIVTFVNHMCSVFACCMTLGIVLHFVKLQQ
jgi:hypothetical protein